MNSNKRIKKITALSLILIVVLTAIMILLDGLGLGIDSRDLYTYFGPRKGGGASTTPIFFGLILIGACYLLVNSDKD